MYAYSANTIFLEVVNDELYTKSTAEKESNADCDIKERAMLGHIYRMTDSLIL